jgi:hypothetical protein
METASVELEMQRQIDDMRQRAISMIEIALQQANERGDRRFIDELIAWANMTGCTDFPGILRNELEKVSKRE